jgi:hypothetical protein
VPTTQVGSACRDTGQLQSELTAHITHIEAYLAASSRRVVDPALHRAKEEFTRYVYHHTSGTRHSEVALLLEFVTRKRKTEGAQRMATSRLNSKQPLYKKQVVKVRHVTARPDRGWLKERRSKKTATTHRGYQPPEFR